MTLDREEQELISLYRRLRGLDRKALLQEARAWVRMLVGTKKARRF